MCGDGIKRHLFPRIFTYSADYPEKYALIASLSSNLTCFYRVLIANIHNLGGCPCPRCLVLKDKVQNVATANDMLQRHVLSWHDTPEQRTKIMSARQLIYEDN